VDQEEYMLSIVFLTALMQQIAAEKDKLK
jgi:hypothetical protein